MDEEKKINKTDILPVLPLRGLNVFPGTVFHFDVGREKSIKALDSALSGDGGRIFLVSQKKLKVEDPKQKDLYSIGTVAKVRQILKLQNNVRRVLIEGICRAKLDTVLEENPYMVASVELFEEEKKHIGNIWDQLKKLRNY